MKALSSAIDTEFTPYDAIVSRLRWTLAAILAAVYILSVLMLELFIMPRYVYSRINLMLAADKAVRRGDRSSEMIDDDRILDDEICEMLEIGRSAAIEVNLFIGPRCTFDIGAQAYSPAGRTLGLSLRGADQLVYAIEDVKRAVRETEQAKDKRALAECIEAQMYGICDAAKQIGVTEELLAIWLENGQVKATVEMNKLFGLGRFLFDEEAIEGAMQLAKRANSA